MQLYLSISFRGFTTSRSFAAVVCLCLISMAAIAQSQRTGVQILVKDPIDRAVPGATVLVKSVETGAEMKATTDDAGKVRFRELSSGRYRISVGAKGFSTGVRELTVGGTVTNDVEIELSAGGISENVTVTATRTQISTDETPVPVSIVGREEIERKAVNTIGDVFRTLPGTSTVNEGAFQVRPRIRGLDSNRVLILVDGERLNNSRTSTGQSGVEIGLVETSQIETIEVVRGSGSVLYGTDALAGTINIITRDTPPRHEDGFRFGAKLDTFYTSNENGRRGSIAVNGSNKFFAFRVAQSLDRFDNYSTGKANGVVPANFLNGGIAPDGEVLNSQSHSGNTQATTRFFFNDTNTLRLNYERRRAANIGSPTLVGVFNAFFPFSNRDKFSGRFDKANLTRQLSRISINAFYQTQYRNFTNILTVPPAPPFFPGQYQFSETVTDTKTSGFDVQTDWILGSRNNLTAGLSFFRDSNSDRRFIERRAQPFTPVLSQDRSRSVPDASLTNFAGFAQNEFRLSSRLKLISGFRIDSFRTNAEPTTGFTIPASFTADQIEDLGLQGLTSGLQVKTTSVTGDLGALFRATENVILSARLGRSFRTPNIFERFFTDFGSVGGFVVGNPNLEPESGINFDTSAKFRTSRFAAGVTYFNNYYQNFLATAIALDRNGLPITIPRGTLPPIPVSQTQNVAEARIQGFEAEIEIPIRIRLGYLTPNGNFSYLRGDNLTRSLPLDFISPYRTNAGVRWQNLAKNYFADYSMRIVGKQDRLSPSFLMSNGGAEPGFVTHNIGGGYYFRRERFNFNVNIGVSNLFNRLYNEQFVFAPARGRSFTIGTSWEIK
ncbi:MAG: TonB-dependent receptor [Acidobacteriota bacterium]|nr:MAG: TonB-dependent receptor [Acidobacteriota bacterium]